jgi:peptide/nickel transport system permease protein
MSETPVTSRYTVAGRRLGLRALGALTVLWAAATFTFFVQALLPGDRATLLLNLSTGLAQPRTPAELAPINAQYGFTQPLLVQYGRYLAGLVRGDLGSSYQLKAPVLSIIGAQIGPTLALTFGALTLAWVVAVTITVATSGRAGWRSGIGSAIETVAAGLPHYWLGIILLVVFAVELRVFPVEGGNSPIGLVLPALTLAVPLAGFLGQVTRDAFETALDQPFVVTARARGMSDTGVRLRHVLRHSILPAVTLSGWALGALFSGAVIVEAVFARQGIGQVLVTATNNRDIPLVSGIVLVVAGMYIVANLLVDLLYRLVDPTLEVSGG